MTTRPWKPNAFFFDFAWIFGIVWCIGWGISKLINHADGIEPNELSFNSYVAITTIAVLWTVIGRIVQNQKAKRQNWTQEVPDPPEAIAARVAVAAKQKADREAEEMRKEYEFQQVSTQRADAIERVRADRAREVAALEQELAYYKNIPSAPEEINE
ncbi:MAG TPA: hypothetical protein VND66_03605 [Acidobacteriaceae bacterium]|nr:hypothetical protein [Acidobacteriaceae bacterium]